MSTQSQRIIQPPRPIVPPRMPEGDPTKPNSQPVFACHVDVGGLDTAGGDVHFAIQMNNEVYVIPDLIKAEQIGHAILGHVSRIKASRRQLGVNLGHRTPDR